VLSSPSDSDAINRHSASRPSEPALKRFLRAGESVILAEQLGSSKQCPFLVVG